MNPNTSPPKASLFARQKVTRSSTSIDVSLDSFSKGTEASSREMKKKEPVLTEIRANSPISSLNFITLHRQYKAVSQNRGDKVSKEVQTTGNKYLNNISRLSEEIQIMNQQLELAYEQINDLTAQINEQNHKHSVHVQKIHEKNQKTAEKMQIEASFYELRTKNEQLLRIIGEKEKEIMDQQLKFNENIAYLTQQYEKKLRFKESEHNFNVSSLKSQFVDVLDELKTKFFHKIDYLQDKHKSDTEEVRELLKGLDSKETVSVSEVSTGLEIDQDRNLKIHESLNDLQIIEELSFQQNMSINPFEQSIEVNNEFDKSLRQLISQISFEGDLSCRNFFMDN